ncbi:MAG: signal peptidase I [Clostridia bacterium]|nr:signal peptidase I [Clostridia bacterium]
MTIKKILNAISSIFIAILLLLAVMLMLNRFVFKQDDMFGYQVYYVSTGSMEPSIPEGSLILCKAVEFEELEEGDVITFVSQQGETRGMRITHEIVNIDPQTGLITTKGEANPHEDDEKVSFENVLGEYQRTLVIFGWVYRVFITPWGLLIFIAPLLAAVVFELVNLFKSAKEEQEKEEQEEDLAKKYEKQLIEQYLKDKKDE